MFIFLYFQFLWEDRNDIAPYNNSVFKLLRNSSVPIEENSHFPEWLHHFAFPSTVHKFQLPYILNNIYNFLLFFFPFS